VAIPPQQQEVAALLRGLAGREPVETHISAVFLGAETVWKLKKAVRLPFLDFSTVALRKRFALREFELNALAAPGLYRDVVPVVRGTDGALALGGGGEPVDWLVRMARVPERDFFDVIAASGGLTPTLHDHVADTVAALHHRLAPVARDQAAALAGVIDGNARSAEAAGLPTDAVRRWRTGAEAALAERADWLRARGEGGFVRRCHGDLHLGNLCLWRGRPVAFDALEFDEELAVIDTAYDLAFLLMDLDRRCGRAAANRVLNRYVARTGDWGLVRGLPLFLSLRAMVLAHVSASRERPEDWRDYLDRALAYLAPPAPVALAIGGLPGTGKSSLARALAPELGPAPGALILRSDEFRKRRFSVAPEERLPPSAYEEPVSRAVLGELCRAAGEVFAAGHAVIADATFIDPADRVAVQSACAAARFLGVWLHAPLPVLEARVAGRSGDASDATVAVLRRAAGADPGAMDWHRADASDGAAALAAVRAALPPSL
jgi:aminoglycoside phosphotransferase family enzyme/predicted kinase